MLDQTNDPCSLASCFINWPTRCPIKAYKQGMEGQVPPCCCPSALIFRRQIWCFHLVNMINNNWWIYPTRTSSELHLKPAIIVVVILQANHKHGEIISQANHSLSERHTLSCLFWIYCLPDSWGACTLILKEKKKKLYPFPSTYI